MDIISFVSCLLRSCCPKTIIFAISFVVVFSLYSEPFTWSFPHIFQEILKIMPAGAYLNATGTIVLIGGVFLIVASPHHAVPNRIFWSFRKAVLERSFNSQIYLPASAALSAKANKVSGVVKALIPAIALAQPSGARVSWSIRRALKSDKTPEPLARKVSDFSSQLQTPHSGVFKKEASWHA